MQRVRCTWLTRHGKEVQRTLRLHRTRLKDLRCDAASALFRALHRAGYTVAIRFNHTPRQPSAMFLSLQR
jgi:hypothetical protein